MGLCDKCTRLDLRNREQAWDPESTEALQQKLIADSNYKTATVDNYLDFLPRFPESGQAFCGAHCSDGKPNPAKLLPGILPHELCSRCANLYAIRKRKQYYVSFCEDFMPKEILMNNINADRAAGHSQSKKSYGDYMNRVERI